MEAVQHRKRPFVLGLFALILSMQAVVVPIFIFVFLVMPPTSPINYNGQEIPIGSIRLEVLGMMVVWFAFAAYVGPGLWRGKPMARHVAFGTYVALSLIAISAYRQWSEIPWLITFYLIVGGYLYGKLNVRTFFESYEPG